MPISATFVSLLNIFLAKYLCSLFLLNRISSEIVVFVSWNVWDFFSDETPEEFSHGVSLTTHVYGGLG